MIPLLALVVCLSTLPRDGGEHVVAKSKHAREIAELVERSESVGFTGALLAADGGKVLVAAGVGYADEANQVPNTAETWFEIASATKQFTAAAVCKLVDQRKLGLDDSIAEHLPAVPADCKAITVRQLLQHTSGIPKTNGKGSGDDLREVVPLFLKGGPKHEPGTHWEYWNQGYALLAGIIEQVSGDSYVEFCQKQLFAPAKMKDSTFTGEDAPRGTVVAVGKSARGNRGALEHPYGSYGYQYKGMGGAVTTVWDLWRWDRALDGKKVLKKDTISTMFEPGLNDYALGWFVVEESGRVRQRHEGAVRGFLCTLSRYPEQDACLVVICNDDEAPVERLTDLFEHALFGEPYVAPPYALSEDRQARLVGTYEDASGGRLEVTTRGRVTQADLHWPSGQMTGGFLGGRDAEGESLVFYAWSASEPVQVTEDDGSVRNLRIGGDTYERSGGH